jgi:hypothetical protein
MQSNWMEKHSMHHWRSRLGLAALLIAMASPAAAGESAYRSNRAKTRPSVSKSCSGFAMLESYDAPAAAPSNPRAQGAKAQAQGQALAQAKSPAWRREGLRQHLRFYREACPDADALPLRRATPEGAR